MGFRHRDLRYWGPHCAGAGSVRPQGSHILLPHAVQSSRQIHPGDSDLHHDGAAIKQFRHVPCPRQQTVEYA